jgi:hypothetical protein
MRTVKKTHNIKLREKGWAERDGFEISLCSENRFSEKYVQFEILSGWDHTIQVPTAKFRTWSLRMIVEDVGKTVFSHL